MCMKRKHKHNDEKKSNAHAQIPADTSAKKKAAFPVSKVFLLQALSEVERLA